MDKYNHISKTDMLDLKKFHEIGGRIDYRQPLEMLLSEFKKGNIADRDRSVEDSVMRDCLGEYFSLWDEVLPTFPNLPWRRRSFWWEYHRGKRDAYLRDVIAEQVERCCCGDCPRVIINPATVFGRHARAIARQLPEWSVLATDIDPVWNFLYKYFVSWWKYGGERLKNFKFAKENVFEGDITRKPGVVTFFGACGSVTDGCMDYAIDTGAPFLICRSCCHDNIGGNTRVVCCPTMINRFFRMKNVVFKWVKKMDRGFYFAEKYAKEKYPRSFAAKELMDSDTIIAIARSSADSDICRSLIDLDRCLHLIENGYDVLYCEELFFAHKR